MIRIAATLLLNLQPGQSRAILDLVKGVSTPEHAAAIEQRNQICYERGYSETSCPHCASGFDCAHCIWAWAIAKVTKRSTLCRCPCVEVGFGHFFNTKCGDTCVDLQAENMNWSGYDPDEAERDPEWADADVDFLEGHISWANEPGWGAQLDTHRDELQALDIRLTVFVEC